MSCHIISQRCAAPAVGLVCLPLLKYACHCCRPTPVYAIIVDQFVNIPFPEWFYSYLVDRAEAWGSDAGRPCCQAIAVQLMCFCCVPVGISLGLVFFCQQACRHIALLTSSKTSIVVQKRHPYTGNLNSEVSGDIKNAFLPCGDVLANSKTRQQQPLCGLLVVIFESDMLLDARLCVTPACLPC